MTGSNRMEEIMAQINEHLLPVINGGAMGNVHHYNRAWEKIEAWHEKHTAADRERLQAMVRELVGALKDACEMYLSSYAQQHYTDILARAESLAGSGERSSAAEVARLHTVAALEVLEERRRQIEQEGWTAGHDAQWQRGELVDAAMCYAGRRDDNGAPVHNWPWDWKWWKPKTYRRDLVRAAALIIAELDRIDRATARRHPEKPQEGTPPREEEGRG